jgi:hypothetical protein
MNVNVCTTTEQQPDANVPNPERALHCNSSIVLLHLIQRNG